MASKPRAEAASWPVPVRLSPVELERFTRAARANRQSLSQFLRESASAALDDADDDRPKRAQRST